MPDNQLDAICADIVREIKDTAAAIAKARGIKGLGLLIPMVLVKVEAIRTDTLPLGGEDKKKLASRILNALIDLPILPDFLEARIFDVVVDWFVEFFNRSFGRNWLNTIRGLIGA